MAYANYRRMMSLPLNPRLSDQDVADVIEAVLDVVAERFTPVLQLAPVFDGERDVIPTVYRPR